MVATTMPDPGGDELVERTASYASGTATIHVWFRIDHANCTIEHLRERDDLTGWTGVLLGWDVLETIDDVVEEEACECPNGGGGIKRCLSVTVIVKSAFGFGLEWGGASVGGEIGSWEHFRTTFRECTNCCCEEENATS